jgi:hypothetical protein
MKSKHHQQYLIIEISRFGTYAYIEKKDSLATNNKARNADGLKRRDRTELHNECALEAYDDSYFVIPIDTKIRMRKASFDMAGRLFHE